MRIGLNLGYGTSAEELADNLALAVAAESLGFDCVWAAEVYGSDAVTVLSVVAARTHRIGIGSAVLHLCLTLVGGAKRDFETTFRVLCFSAGSAYPLMIVPICGGLISGIWCLVCECIGLAKAHDTTTGKALLAVLLPVIVCCGGGFVCAMMFGVLGALTGHH